MPYTAFHLRPSHPSQPEQPLSPASAKPTGRVQNLEIQERLQLANAVLIKTARGQTGVLSPEAAHAEALGRAIGMTEPELRDVHSALALHDIGQSLLPQGLLDKAGPLDVFERQLVRHHPLWSDALIACHPQFGEHVRAGVRDHHERFDGQGYPAGKQGQDISLIGRLLSIVTVYHALLRDRPYQRAWTETQAAHELLLQANAQFDPVMVRLFVWEVLQLDLPDPAMRVNRNN